LNKDEIHIPKNEWHIIPFHNNGLLNFLNLFCFHPWKQSQIILKWKVSPSEYLCICNFIWFKKNFCEGLLCPKAWPIIFIHVHWIGAPCNSTTHAYGKFMPNSKFLSTNESSWRSFFTWLVSNSSFNETWVEEAWGFKAHIVEISFCVSLDKAFAIGITVVPFQVQQKLYYFFKCQILEN